MSDGLRDSMEDALFDDPDDIATHRAYADLLCDEGDPRGEFIQVQLALEDEGLSPGERSRLRAREAALLAAHERQWLGELAPLLLGTVEEQRALIAAQLKPENSDRLNYTPQQPFFRHAWRRGWLDRFECYDLTVEMARQLGRAHVAQLLRTLHCRGGERAAVFAYPYGADCPSRYGDFQPIEVLAHYPTVRNLRVFQFGTEPDPEEDVYQDGTQFVKLAPLIVNMPRLEGLHLFAHTYLPEVGHDDLTRIFSSFTLYGLRVLRHYHGQVYPLDVLAANPAVRRLTRLECFPHSFARDYDYRTGEYGDFPINRENVRAVVTSPYLNSLTHLLLRCCSGGDASIADLVSTGTLKRLRSLDLRHGYVTDDGARLLAGCPELHGLERLDLTNNRLTAAGIDLLKATGVRLVAEGQQVPPFDDESILYFGDSE